MTPSVLSNLLYSPNLAVLRLVGLDIGDEHVSAIAEPLRLSKSLKTLLMWKTGITVGGTRVLTQALSANSSVEIVNLNDNAEIGEQGCKVLFQSLLQKNSCNLRELYASCSHMSRDCQSVLVSLVAAKTTLRRLEECFGWPKDQTAEEMKGLVDRVGKAFSTTGSLKELHLYGDGVANTLAWAFPIWIDFNEEDSDVTDCEEEDDDAYMDCSKEK
jgi:hypothetical protein